jgi:hypothetical protein
MDNPETWQKVANALDMNVEIDPEKVRTLFSEWDTRTYNCGSLCKNGNPCGIWVRKGQKCWRHLNE